MTWRRPKVEKDPNSFEPQSFDWTAYLALLGDGVLIVDSDWSVSTIDDDGAPLVVSDDSIIGAGLMTQVFISGGTAGQTYVVTNRITTNSTPPVIDDRSFTVKVKEK